RPVVSDGKPCPSTRPDTRSSAWAIVTPRQARESSVQMPGPSGNGTAAPAGRTKRPPAHAADNARIRVIAATTDDRGGDSARGARGVTAGWTRRGRGRVSG